MCDCIDDLRALIGRFKPEDDDEEDEQPKLKVRAVSIDPHQCLRRWIAHVLASLQKKLKTCESHLLKQLEFVLNELLPWETKLASALRRMKLKMKKELDSWVEEKPTKKKVRPEACHVLSAVLHLHVHVHAYVLCSGR